MIENTAVNIMALFFMLLCFLLLCESRTSKGKTALIAGGIALVCTAAFLIARWRGMPPVPAAALFLTLPTFVCYAFLSRFRGFRYIFTFCSVDIGG